MTLKERIKHIVSDNLEFIIASSTYVAANIADYLLTVHGINSTRIGEGGVLLQHYANQFGAENGLLISKSLLCGSVLLGSRYIDYAYNNDKTKIKAEYLLYPGAALTALGGSMWLLIK